MTKTQNYSHMHENKDLSSVFQPEEKKIIKNHQLLSEQLQVKCLNPHLIPTNTWIAPPHSFYYPEIPLMYKN